MVAVAFLLGVLRALVVIPNSFHHQDTKSTKGERRAFFVTFMCFVCFVVRTDFLAGDEQTSASPIGVDLPRSVL
jgi:hypothetical protein